MDDEFLEFLRARLDEDKAAAESATPGPWVANPYVDHDCDFEALIGTGSGVHDCGNVVGHGYEGGGVEKLADAEHIARHDPARVLREVEAKRDLVRLFEKAHDYPPIFMSGLGQRMEDTLLTFASVYADHPDYRPEWAPTA